MFNYRISVSCVCNIIYFVFFYIYFVIFFGGTGRDRSSLEFKITAKTLKETTYKDSNNKGCRNKKEKESAKK